MDVSEGSGTSESLKILEGVEDPGRLGVPSRSGVRRAGTLDLRREVPGLSLQPEGVGIMVEGVARREQGLLQGDGDEPRRKPPAGAYLLQVVKVLRVPPPLEPLYLGVRSRYSGALSMGW